MQNENRVKEFSDSCKCNNIHIVVVPEGGGGGGGKRRRKKQTENLFEEMIAENLSNLGKEKDLQIQKEWRTPSKINKS